MAVVAMKNSCDGGHRERHGAVAEDGFPAEDGDDFRDDPEGWQDHDVDRRMRVEPEDELVQQGV